MPNNSLGFGSLMLFLMASAGASFTTILALSKNDEFRVIAYKIISDSR